MEKLLLAILLHIFTIAIHFLTSTNAYGGIGVCYGMLGNDLPSAADVIGLYKRNNVGKVRLFDPNPAALASLRGSGIAVTVGIRNEDLQGMALNPNNVATWYATNIEPYLADVVFEYIAVGNEVIPGEIGQYVCRVMQSMQGLLRDKALYAIRVTTVVPESVLSVSFPPSAGAFSDPALADLTCVFGALQAQGSPLMVNAYPYFAYASNPADIRLDYAQFTATQVIVQDGNYGYTNLFDSIVDAFFAAMEKQGFGGLAIVVSESGWPSAGNDVYTSPVLASTYNKNFVQHILSGVGTPRRPGTYIEGFLFAMFNEDLKPAGVEQNFGLFYPSMQPVYPMF